MISFGVILQIGMFNNLIKFHWKMCIDMVNAVISSLGHLFLVVYLIFLSLCVHSLIPEYLAERLVWSSVWVIPSDVFAEIQKLLESFPWMDYK